MIYFGLLFSDLGDGIHRGLVLLFIDLDVSSEDGIVGLFDVDAFLFEEDEYG